jgi:predicted ATP-grasp superfamily ATP-dependent carboligase
MNVLVLDGNENQAVACVRSLARAGYTVCVGAASTWSKASLSRFCRNTFTYPAPEEDAADFVRCIIQEVGRQPGSLVLPMTERSTLPLSERRAEVVAAGGHLVLPPHETVLRAFDKLQMIRLGESLGMSIPQTVLVESLEKARELASSLWYPVVLKPRSSNEVTLGGSVRSTGPPRYAQTPDQFLSAYDELRDSCSHVLVQEFVEGQGAGYVALMHNGQLLAEFAYLRLRDVRPSGSGSSLRISVRPEPRVRADALKLLCALKWHGAAMVEFRIQRDGTPTLMEVNGRFWNSLALAIYAGVDFPVLLARLAEDRSVEHRTNYRAGVRCRWLVGDFRHLLEVWRGAPTGYPGTFPARLETLLRFLMPVPGTYHDNFQWLDPLPEFGDWAHFLLRQLPAAAKKRWSRKELHAKRRYSHP